MGSQAFTGNYYLRDVCVDTQVVVKEGSSVLVLLRGQGTRRYYALGLCREDRFAILRYENGERTELASGKFIWECGRPYQLSARAKGTELTLSVDGRTFLTAEDDHLTYGMAGLGTDGPGTVICGGFHVSGSC